jgi:flagellar basal body-associated protein FliL
VADEFVDEQQPEIAVEAPVGQTRGLFRLVKAIAFVSVIVVVEVVVAAMLAPNAQDTSRLAKELVAASAGETESLDGREAGDSTRRSAANTLSEVELGLYNITRFNPATNTTLAIDFELHGTVLANDASVFKQLFDRNKARIREQVVMTLHGATSADLTDAGLGLIKRRVLEKTNRALGQPLLKEVLFSKFNFVER